tara:strand:- start:1506 stop:1760 length:255 start_codon:yes stop_codon:yes gene_type:complete
MGIHDDAPQRCPLSGHFQTLDLRRQVPYTLVELCCLPRIFIGLTQHLSILLRVSGMQSAYRLPDYALQHPHRAALVLGVPQILP